MVTKGKSRRLRHFVISRRAHFFISMTRYFCPPSFADAGSGVIRFRVQYAA
jgi:hypothetical protein